MASGKPGSEQVQEWVVEHGDSLYRYALSMVRDRAAAEDLVQDAFLAALTAAPGFRGHSNPRTWLTGILRHKILDYYRSRAREARWGASEADDGGEMFSDQGGWIEPPAALPSDPHQALADQEFRAVLDECIDSLDESKRAVVLLRAFEELSAKEICKELRISSTNLWVLLHRARAALRRCLEKRWFGDREL